MSYKLTPEHAKLWLPVVRELREYYEGKNDRFIENCPLCNVAITIKEELCGYYSCKECPLRLRKCDKCLVCLWELYEGKSCPKDANQKRAKRSYVWCKQSISRLKQWEERLGEIIRGKK